MLESLFRGHGSIHEMNVAGAFPERAPYQPWQLYAELKATPLFDPERGQWNWSMSEAQVLEDTDRFAFDQLLAVLVEAQFSPRAARELYDNLKQTPLFDAKRRQWNQRISEAKEPRNPAHEADVQLLGVLVENQFNSQGAQKLYESLKQTPLFDPEQEQWNASMSEAQELCTSRYASAQLLGVLVEAQFNPQKAQELYERLKQTVLYDPERRQWILQLSKAQELHGKLRCAPAQLFGVLVEAQFNLEGAQELYERLKQTVLYDPERRQWIWSMSKEQESFHSERFTSAQLLGVLVEATLLRSLPKPLTEAIPPLPVTEDW